MFRKTHYAVLILVAILLAVFWSGGWLLTTRAQEDATSCPNASYVVQPGDTLSGIALQYDGVTAADIRAANPSIPTNSLIVPDQMLCIPAGKTAVSSPPPHNVTILAPDVPESTAYSGQLVTELLIDPADFRPSGTAPEQSDQMLDFSGNQGYLELPVGTLPTRAGTIAHWVRRDQSNDQAILLYSSDSGTTRLDATRDGWGAFDSSDDLLEIHTALTEDGHAYFLYQNGTGSSTTSLVSRTYLEPDKWYHVAVTYEAGKVITGTETAVGSATLYINGNPEAHAPLPVAPEQESGLTLVGRPVNPSRRFAGQLDDLQIWSRPLSETEIVASFNQSGDLSLDGMSGYWRFNETSRRANNRLSDNYQGELKAGLRRVASSRRSPTDGGSEAAPSQPPTVALLTTAFVQAKSSGVFDTLVFPELSWITSDSDRQAAIKALNGGVASEETDEAGLPQQEFLNRYQAGERLVMVRTTNNELRYEFVEAAPQQQPHLFLIERYRLSSFAGAYGTGRVLNTFSLLPAETAQIAIETYRQSSVEAATSSSILDSYTQESADSFERAVASERSLQSSRSEHLAARVSAEAEASWGWGSANVSTEVTGSLNQSRRSFARNISNAVSRHAAQASASRNIAVNTSSQTTTTTGERQAVVRQIANPNSSRTLNFVFYQMNQEYITILHLVDVQVGYTDGAGNTVVVPLAQLDSLLQTAVNDNAQAKIRAIILDELRAIQDYQDQPQPDFIEERQLVSSGGSSQGYWRINHDSRSVYLDRSESYTVPGIIMAVNKVVMRTDGVYVDAVLGQNSAWDDYNERLHEEQLRKSRLQNDLLERNGRSSPSASP